MKKWVYKTLLTICAIVALIGCVVMGTGLKSKYDKYSLEQTKLQNKATIEMVQDATVFLMGQNEKYEVTGTGTGFVIKSDEQGSWIITNKHICTMSRYSTKEYNDNGGLFTFRPLVALSRHGRPQGVLVVKVAQNADLCLLRTEEKFKKPLKLAAKVKSKEKMFTFGFPGGKPELNFGIYKGTEGNPNGFYSATDLKIWYGASGSAVVNMNGEVIGVISNIRFLEDIPRKKQTREKVFESLFIPLEILREFIGGL